MIFELMPAVFMFSDCHFSFVRVVRQHGQKRENSYDDLYDDCK